jgi:hypothetical protein
VLTLTGYFYRWFPAAGHANRKNKNKKILADGF